MKLNKENNALDINGYTEIITANRNVFSFQFKEIWRYRDLILLFVKRDMASQYRQTILGPLWHILQPAVTTFIFLILFNRIAHIPTDNVPAVIFYMSGLTAWNYFSSCFTATSATFITNASVFGKVYFPRIILPLSVVLSNMIRFAIQFCLLVIVICYYAIFQNFSISIGWHTLLIPVILLIMAGLGLGAGIIVSSITTKYRDVAVLINFGIQLLMFVTPVGYSLAYLRQHSSYANVISLNPLSSLIESFRYAMLGSGIFSVNLFLYSVIFTLLALIIGIIIFNRVEKTFMDTV